jgi:ankyrin repeat protein
VVKILLDAGANVNATAVHAGREGQTALQAAAEGGHLEVVRMLLDAGANVNATATGYRDRTALQAAAGGGHLEVVRMLLDAGANVNAAAAAEHGGQTALQAAAEGDHLKIVRMLLRAGANVTTAAAGDWGLTAWEAVSTSPKGKRQTTVYAKSEVTNLETSAGKSSFRETANKSSGDRGTVKRNVSNYQPKSAYDHGHHRKRTDSDLPRRILPFRLISALATRLTEDDDEDTDEEDFDFRFP